MVSTRWSRLTAVGGASLLLLAGAARAAAEPVITLKVPPFPTATFANFSSVVLPTSGYETLEIHLTEALAPVQTSTVRVTINDRPMTPFVAVNPTPTGVRIIVRLGATANPDFGIRREGETILAFEAIDTSGTGYRGQFYLSIDEARDIPEPAPIVAGRRHQQTVIPPNQQRAPTVHLSSTAPMRTSDRVFWLEAEVTDADGLRKVVIELNGRAVEEVVLQNERPVRYKNGRLARGGLAGEVSGDGSRVRLRIPLTLGKDRINVLAVRAENVHGLGTRADRTVEVFR